MSLSDPQPTVSDGERPLLSICIPTCNRAGFLRVMLQALLPQVRQFPDEVEVWVLDNASTDQTAQILTEAAALGPFHVHRQSQNVGPTRNIVYGPATLARGTHVWVLGDHNLLRQGALQRVLACLKNHPGHQLFYMNFRTAAYPSQWPAVAIGGHEGSFQYLGNPEITDGVVPHWFQLLRPYSAVCTQNYVHIISTRIWRDFWKNGVQGEDYSSAETTYPHTLTIVNGWLQQPVVVLADAVLTIFNGAQSWGNPVTRVQVYFTGLPLLLQQLQKRGLPHKSLQEIRERFYAPESARVIRDVCQRCGRLAGLTLVLRHLGANRHGWHALLAVLPEILLPRLTSGTRRLAGWCRNYRSWYLFNFRPARWLRSLTTVRPPAHAASDTHGGSDASG